VGEAVCEAEVERKQHTSGLHSSASMSRPAMYISIASCERLGRCHVCEKIHISTTDSQLPAVLLESCTNYTDGLFGGPVRGLVGYADCFMQTQGALGRIFGCE
jgi:hypothetical protein